MANAMPSVVGYYEQEWFGRQDLRVFTRAVDFFWLVRGLLRRSGPAVPPTVCRISASELDLYFKMQC